MGGYNYPITVLVYIPNRLTIEKLITFVNDYMIQKDHKEINHILLRKVFIALKTKDFVIGARPEDKIDNVNNGIEVSYDTLEYICIALSEHNLVLKEEESNPGEGGIGLFNMNNKITKLKIYNLKKIK